MEEIKKRKQSLEEKEKELKKIELEKYEKKDFPEDPWGE